ncbi:MAG: hypothetical protein R1F54_02520 [Candidatus Zeuxoniibacter abyssi]|nr:MAG: hypothetical protein R1F54_02520 [Candidatus Persebacteraceae bacterium AB1(2)]
MPSFAATQKSPAVLPLADNMPCARIFDNTQFLYELHLAIKEVQTLAGECELAEDLRSFRLPNSSVLSPVAVTLRLYWQGGEGSVDLSSV